MLLNIEPIVVRETGWLIAAVAGVAIVIAGELYMHWHSRSTLDSDNDRGTYQVIAAAIVGAIAIAVGSQQLLPELSLADGGEWPMIVGSILFVAGLAIRWWAIRTLGQHFQLTVVSGPGHKLISRGPYAFVRHPSYTGTLLFLTAAGFAMDNLGSVLAMSIIPALGLGRRIAVEEEFLAKNFDEYDDYVARTSRLIPGPRALRLGRR